MKIFTLDLKTAHFTSEAIKLFELGKKIITELPEETQDFLAQVIKGEVRAGICCDFDNTLVPTNEASRIFSSLDEDPSGTKAPLCGFAIIDKMPVGIISGNTVEYVTSRCAEPIQDFMLESPFKQNIVSISIYALNGGYVLSYDKNGAEDSEYMLGYNASKKMPSVIAEKITRIMLEELSKRVKKIIARGYDPLEARVGETTIYTFSPMLQDRAGVQKCIVGVDKNIREDLISVLRDRAVSEKIGKNIDIQPGGQYSIDCQMTSLKKRFAGRDFMVKYGLSHLIYLGDAVYLKSDGNEGNDYSMVHNKNTFVFAVNADREEVPKSKGGRVQWFGDSPESSKIFLTWLLICRASFLCRSQPQRANDIRNAIKYLGFSN